MDRKQKKLRAEDSAVAPGMDPEDSYGKRATKSEIEKGESTTTTRLTYDAFDPSKR
ncbi:hypothetical protein [Oceanobacillus saliphilus]|uniref:hypothetical protein n=1 Tax=Oceanobacillus saliphilus TaxID=2925834 RepID=UPI00201DC379|nr:hypothetical protein [Oceanobacillus saliphilus]